MISKSLFLVWMALLFSSLCSAKSMTILVCYPGGSVRAQDAKPAMDSMLRVLQETGNWSPGNITNLFASDIKNCQKLLLEKKPEFAISSLGIYLQNRIKFQLIPLVQPQIQNSTTDNYRILVRKGTYSSIDTLKGKTLGGSLLEEKEFLSRIVFRGKLDPSTFFQLKSSRQVLRSLRDLSKGKLDAVLVNAQQYKALGSLSFAKNLEVVFTSDAFPLMGVIANQGQTTQEQRNRFTAALSKMCTHEEGKKLCQLFGLETFVPADPAAYQTLIRLWGEK